MNSWNLALRYVALISSAAPQIAISAAGFTATADAKVANEVPILVTADAPTSPVKAAFESPSGGEIDFKRVAEGFEGQRAGMGHWVRHDVALHYPNFSITLALQTWHKDKRIQINGRLWQVECDKEDVGRIMRVTSASPQRDVFGAIIAARYLSTRPGNTCPTYVKTQLAQQYFKLSCNFAKRVEFFGLSNDAIQTYSSMSAGYAQEAQACRNQVRGLLVKRLNASLQGALNANSLDDAELLNAELQELRQDADWLPAVIAAGIEPAAVDALGAKLIYMKSIDASQRGDYAAALALNSELRERLEEPGGNAFMAKVRIDKKLLATDADFFNTKIEATRQVETSLPQTP